MKNGMEVEFRHLPVADYLIENIAIERKTLSDFKSSLINKRLITQIIELKQYPKHILILEGFDFPNNEVIHENAFRGALLSIAIEHNTPLIFTKNIEDTAKYFSLLAKKKKAPLSLRPSKIFKTKKEQLQHILEGFPNIGPVKAKALIKEFKTLKNIINAQHEHLEKFLGKKTTDFLGLIE